MSIGVVVLEGDADLRGDILRALASAGYRGVGAATLDEAIGRARTHGARAALVEIGSVRDLERVEALAAALPASAIIAMSGQPSVDLVVGAMRRGAREFVRKPFRLEALEAALAGAIAPPAARSVPPLQTASPRMQSVLDEARAAAASEATVQIVGESGTGKELLARTIHAQSPRAAGAAIFVNCAALPASLAESELYGHERGAFTGATEARTGQLQAADGGTLVLDEVSDAAPAVQTKLLRVLQEREVLPLGARVPRRIDVRIVAISQRELAAEVAAGRFREDLYYRLDVIVLRIPPLRERAEDIPLLARAFLSRFAEAAGVEAPTLDDSAAERLAREPFRGNVRELENLMRRAVVLHPGRALDLDALLGRGGSPDLASPRGDWPSLNLRELERVAIERSLAAERGNRTRASARLGISVRTLRNKIRLYGLA